MERRIAAYESRFPAVKALHVGRSTRKGKRYAAEFVMNGRPHRVDFGQDSATTYLDGAPTAKMRAYRARASKITDKYDRYTYKVPGTANSFSYWLLW